MSCNSAVVLSFFLTFNSFAQIVLSEIMFNPHGNERYDEFIELYNVSESETIDLIGWLLSDGSKFNTILPYTETARLLPRQYAIILVPSYFQASACYDTEIPTETLILTIAESQFGANGLKNSEGEIVSIHTPDTTLAASYQYTPDNKDGFSEEKIDLDSSDVEMNWRNSVRQGGTPGYENSVMRRSYDLALTAIRIASERVTSSDSLLLCLDISNVGRFAVDHCTLALFDSTREGNILLAQKRVTLNSLAPAASMEVSLTLAPLMAGDHSIVAVIDCTQDEYIDNNSASIPCQVTESYPPGSVVINEIMYDTDEKSQEWLEILNRSQLDIDLIDWRLQDARKSVVLTGENDTLKAGGFCVLANVARDSAGRAQILVANLPELNNSGDTVVLLDAADVTIDSVSYDRSFGGGRFISIERIRDEGDSSDPDNWASCTDENGGTPGQVNSSSPKERDAAIGDLRFHPTQPHDGEDVIITVEIVNAGRCALDEISVTLSYRPIGQSVVLPIGEVVIDRPAETSVASAELIWPRIEPGVHVVTADISMYQDMIRNNDTRSDTIIVSYSAASVVINEIMYSPLVGEGEWIELYNRSDTPVELMNWSISDRDSLKRICLLSASHILPSQHFIAIGQDSSLLDKTPAAIICSHFISLGNDMDDVIVYDGCGRIIDHVAYEAEMGGERGRSLERINPFTASPERTNWTTCVHTDGHTAGRSNSIALKVTSSATLLSVSPNPFSPDGDGMDDFAGIHYSLPATLANVNLKIFDMNGRLVRFLLNNQPSGAQRTVYWDGLDEAGTRCRMGIYVISLQALDEARLCIEHAKKTVVLAGRL
ncbi:lamin tail domain-containing protein [candidate division KSB1 bacterium]|nr:lamin tail domain-containing protein [candidate division KSB1 bacterium]RQW06354.1 MAG: hypothetical protein EH222_08850 [candidate division KSB1 bacterium]